MDNEDLDIKIELIGFDKHPKFENLVKGLMDDLYMECPSDATMTATFIKEKSRITGSIQVNAIDGTFAAQADGKIARDVIKSVIDQMQRELKLWHKSRNHVKKDTEFDRPDFQQELESRESQ